MYVERLRILGIYKQVNRTRLNDNILQHFPDVQAQNDGKNIVIVFKEGMKTMLPDIMKARDFNENAELLLELQPLSGRT